MYTSVKMHCESLFPKLKPPHCRTYGVYLLPFNRCFFQIFCQSTGNTGFCLRVSSEQGLSSSTLVPFTRESGIVTEYCCSAFIAPHWSHIFHHDLTWYGKTFWGLYRDQWLNWSEEHLRFSHWDEGATVHGWYGLGPPPPPFFLCVI